MLTDRQKNRLHRVEIKVANDRDAQIGIVNDTAFMLELCNQLMAKLEEIKKENIRLTYKVESMLLQLPSVNKY